MCVCVKGVMCPFRPPAGISADRGFFRVGGEAGGGGWDLGLFCFWVGRRFMVAKDGGNWNGGGRKSYEERELVRIVSESGLMI